MRLRWTRIAVLLLAAVAAAAQARSQTLESLLASEGPETLARAAREAGDARRGAILFHRTYRACAKCHATGEDNGPPRLGPDLARLDQKEASDTSLVESVLLPSKTICKGYEAVSIALADGRTITARILSES